MTEDIINDVLDNQDVGYSEVFRNYRNIQYYQEAGSTFPGFDIIKDPDKVLIKCVKDAIKHGLPNALIPKYIEGSSIWEILTESQKEKIFEIFSSNIYSDIASRIHPERWLIIGTQGKPEFFFDACGEDIIDAFKPSIVTEYQSELLHVFLRDRYLVDAEPFLKSLIQHFAPITFMQIAKTIQYIKNKTRIVDPELIGKTMEEIRPLPDNLIPMSAGLLNLDTRKILLHNPDFYYISPFARNYIPGGKSEKFRAFLEIIFKDDPNKNTKITQIFELIAWTISSKYIPQGAAFLIGSGGEGKSIIVGIIEALLGPGITASVSIQELENDKFKRAELYGKKANIVNEAGGLIHSEWFKKTTDGSTITADRKNGNNFKFQNGAKWIMATNKLPEVNDELRAFYRRVAVIINFENYLEDNIEPEKISEYIDALHEPHELDLIFSETLDVYYSDFIKRKKFFDSLSLEDAEAEYNRRANPNLAYLRELSDKGSILTDPEEVEKFITEQSLNPEFVFKDDKKSNLRHFVTIKKYIEKDAKQWAIENKLQPDLIDTIKLGKALNKLDYSDITTEKRIESAKFKAWLDVFIVPYSLDYFKSSGSEKSKKQGTLDSGKDNNNTDKQEPERGDEKKEEKTDNDDTGDNLPGNPDSDKSDENEAPKKEEDEEHKPENPPKIPKNPKMCYYKIMEHFNSYSDSYFDGSDIILDSYRPIYHNNSSNLSYILLKVLIPENLSQQPGNWMKFLADSQEISQKQFEVLSRGDTE